MHERQADKKRMRKSAKNDKAERKGQGSQIHSDERKKKGVPKKLNL